MPDHQQKFLPPNYFLALLIAASIVQAVFRPAPVFKSIWAGAAVMAAGFAFMLGAMKHFGRRKTPVRHSEKPTALVTEGIYKFTRNPMYVGIIVFLIGLALLAGTWPFWAVPAAMFLVLEIIFIPWEEKRMEELFKEEYTRYRRKVRRWI